MFLLILVLYASFNGMALMSDKLNDNDLLRAFFESADDKTDLKELCADRGSERYTGDEPAGEGGAKKVYKSTDRITGRILARAFPKFDDDRSCEDFIREARLHSLLEHPNIIPLYDIGYANERPYFSMKYVQGKTLEQHVRSLSYNELQTPKRRNEMLDIFLKVCDAVAFAHSRGVLHLDLKPENIHLSNYGEVLVGDWGLARIEGTLPDELDQSENVDFGQYTRHGMLAGTPGFMAPEQLEKGVVKGAFTDIYSLGCMLIYLLTGQEAVSGSPAEKMEKTRLGELRFREQSIPVGLLPVVQRATALEPEDRYACVQDLINDINTFRAGYLTSAEEPSFARQMVTLYQRNKKESLMILSSVALIIALTLAFISRIRQEQHKSVVQERLSAKALAMYHQAEQAREETARKAFEQFLNESQKRYTDEARGHYDYKPSDDVKAYHLVNQALAFDDTQQEAWALKGKLAMMIDDFEDAIFSFEKAGEALNAYREICIRYKNTNLNELPNLISMLHELQHTGDHRMVNNFIFRTIFSDLRLSDRLYFCEETMKLKSPRQKELNFKFNTDTFSLDLSDNRDLYTIYMIKNLPVRELNLSNSGMINHDFIHLRTMPLIKLDVSNTRFTDQSFRYIRGKNIRELSLRNCKVADLTPLTTMPLETLDIRGTKCRDFSFLKQLPKLRQLVCSKEQEPRVRAAIGSRPVELTVR